MEILAGQSSESYSEQFDIIRRAIDFAAVAHLGQVRKGSDSPYIVHPMEAMMICASMTSDPEVIAAAALHDVLEDTDFSYDDILAEFGKRVADLVATESEDKRPELPAADTWQIRKQETIDRASHEPIEAKMILLSDKLSNLRSTCRDYRIQGDLVWQRFNVTDPAMHKWYYKSLAQAMTELSKYPAYQEYLSCIEELFSRV